MKSKLFIAVLLVLVVLVSGCANVGDEIKKVCFSVPYYITEECGGGMGWGGCSQTVVFNYNSKEYSFNLGSYGCEKKPEGKCTSPPSYAFQNLTKGVLHMCGGYSTVDKELVYFYSPELYKAGYFSQNMAYAKDNLTEALSECLKSLNKEECYKILAQGIVMNDLSNTSTESAIDFCLKINNSEKMDSCLFYIKLTKNYAVWNFCDKKFDINKDNKGFWDCHRETSKQVNIEIICRSMNNSIRRDNCLWYYMDDMSDYRFCNELSEGSRWKQSCIWGLRKGAIVKIQFSNLTINGTNANIKNEEFKTFFMDDLFSISNQIEGFSNLSIVEWIPQYNYVKLEIYCSPTLKAKERIEPVYQITTKLLTRWYIKELYMQDIY